MADYSREVYLRQDAGELIPLDVRESAQPMALAQVGTRFESVTEPIKVYVATELFSGPDDPSTGRPRRQLIIVEELR